jgi:hypothetical protein
MSVFMFLRLSLLPVAFNFTQKYQHSQIHPIRTVILPSNIFVSTSFHVTPYVICLRRKLSSVSNYFSFLVSLGGVRLSPLYTSATNWPIVPAPDDR